MAEPALLSHDLRSLARAFYLGEMTDHVTYRMLSQATRRTELRGLLERISTMEAGHAAFWRGVLERLGESVPEHRPPVLRNTLLRLLARIVNPLFLIAFLELGENQAAKTYHQVLQSGLLEPKENARLREIIMDELEHESLFHRQSRQSGLGNVRDFVLGMNDGLVEILGAVTGLSAAWPGNPLMVAISGLIVGIAGALSMGIGAFISVRSQRQVNEARRERLQLLFSVAPERARDEFSERLEEAGLPESVSREVAERVGEKSASLVELLVGKAEENEWRSAFFTGMAYLFGVLFPVLPYFLADSSIHALIGSVFFAGLALASVGSLIALFSGISLRTKVLEMVVSGFSAAGLAYLFGRLMQALFGVEV